MYRNCLSLKIIQVDIIEKIEEKNHFFFVYQWVFYVLNIIQMFFK